MNKRDHKRPGYALSGNAAQRHGNRRSATRGIPTPAPKGQNQAAIDLLQSWLVKDCAEQKRTWPELKHALNAGRRGQRKLLP